MLNYIHQKHQVQLKSNSVLDIAFYLQPRAKPQSQQPFVSLVV